MKHKQYERQVAALARRKLNVETYTKQLNSGDDKLFFDGEEVSRSFIQDKLKKAEKDVEILAKKVESYVDTN
jgi:hypothetical protein